MVVNLMTQLLLSRFSFGLFLAMFEIKQTRNRNEIHKSFWRDAVPSRSPSGKRQFGLKRIETSTGLP